MECQRHVCNAGSYLYRQTVGIVSSRQSAVPTTHFWHKGLGCSRPKGGQRAKVAGAGAVVSPFYELLLAC